MNAGRPIFAPSNVQDVIDLGLLGFAMSRYTGLYTGFKLTNETLEQTMTVDVNYGDNGPIFPERGPAPANGLHNYPTHPDRIESAIVLTTSRWSMIDKITRANQQKTNSL